MTRKVSFVVTLLLAAVALFAPLSVASLVADGSANEVLQIADGDADYGGG